MIKGVLCLLLLMFSGVSAALAVPGAGEVGKGNEAYLKGNFKEAANLYEAAAVKAPNDPRIDYNLGAAAYKTGKYMDAAGFFNKTLLADNPRLHEDGQYNLANALYKAGIEKEEKDIESAVKNVQESLKGYDKVLAQDGKNEDARINRALVAVDLERLKKKMQEQKKQQKQDSSGNKKKSSSDKDQPQNGQEQKQNDQKNAQQEKDQAQQSKDGAQNQGQDQEKSTAGQEQKVEDQKSGSAQKSADNKEASDKQGASVEGAEQGQILSQDEANMLLDDFAQNEQPQGLLNFVREPHQERPVNKDW